MSKIRIVNESPATEIRLADTSCFDKGPQPEDVIDVPSPSAEVTAIFEWKSECKIETDQKPLSITQAVLQPLRDFRTRPGTSTRRNQPRRRLSRPADRYSNSIVISSRSRPIDCDKGVTLHASRISVLDC
jgi:hypothetical protein